MASKSLSRLRVERLSVRFGKQYIIRELSFGLEAASITAVIGPSGAGKSTLLLALAGLLPDGAKREGSLLYHDTEKPLGLVFQKPLVFPLSIFENVALALRERGVKDLAPQVERAMRDAGIWEELKNRLYESAKSLSGGQQQRLCLARVLALGPSVLLLDEPCSSLDPISTRALEATFRKLAEHCAILIVTHNLAQAKRLSDRAIVLWPGEDGGRILEEGLSSELFARPRHELVQDYLEGYF